MQVAEQLGGLVPPTFPEEQQPALRDGVVAVRDEVVVVVEREGLLDGALGPVPPPRTQQFLDDVRPGPRRRFEVAVGAAERQRALEVLQALVGGAVDDALHRAVVERQHLEVGPPDPHRGGHGLVHQPAGIVVPVRQHEQLQPVDQHLRRELGVHHGLGRGDRPRQQCVGLLGVVGDVGHP